MFELYSTGNYSLEDFQKLGLTNQKGNPYSLSRIYETLKRPIYYGVFKFKGEIYQGIHEPIITKKLFDQVQDMMIKRGKKRKNQNHDYSFIGLMKCICGCSVTAEKQKGHVYYRCTKKKGPCDQKYIREEDLITQFKYWLKKVSIPDDWADKMIAEIDKEKNQQARSSITLVNSLRTEIISIDEKLDKLLDSHLEGIIENQDYLKKKEQLINIKNKLAEKIKELNKKGSNWLEPMRDFILDLKQTKKAASSGDHIEMKTFLKKIGSNFILKDKKFEFLANFGWRILAQNAPFSDWSG